MGRFFLKLGRIVIFIFLTLSSATVFADEESYCGVDPKGVPYDCPGTCGYDIDGVPFVCPNENPDPNKGVPEIVNSPYELPYVAPPAEVYKPIGIDLEGLQAKANELNPGGFKSPELFVGRLIKGIMGIVGSLSLVMFIYGGILLMTDRGSGEQTAKAKEIIVWTSLGLAVLFAAYAIVNFIFEAFR